MLKLRSIGLSDYAVLECGQRIGRIRLATERMPCVWWPCGFPANILADRLREIRPARLHMRVRLSGAESLARLARSTTTERFPV